MCYFILAYVNFSDGKWWKTGKYWGLKFIEIKEKIIEEIKKIYDPEIPVNIYELGLIYDIQIDQKKAKIKMTLTSPNCPVAESLPQEVKDKVKSLDQVSDVELEMTFDPPWNKELMSDEAKLELGFL